MKDYKTTLFGAIAAIALTLKQQFSPEYGWIFDIINSLGIGLLAYHAKDKDKNENEIIK